MLDEGDQFGAAARFLRQFAIDAEAPAECRGIRIVVERVEQGRLRLDIVGIARQPHLDQIVRLPAQRLVFPSLECACNG